MSPRARLVGLVAVIALGVFAAAALYHQRSQRQQADTRAAEHASAMVRAHSPVIGPIDAPVTIVEFFDPACESCRAFYPLVKQTLAAFPRDARLVIRYVPFHQEPSVVAIQILEAAREQGRFESVLDALLQAQPIWASHDQPAPERAWEFAKAAGLDLDRARAFAATGAVEKLLAQDVADLQSVGVRATPTFFVNGRPLPQPDPAVLHQMVESEVQRARAAR